MPPESENSKRFLDAFHLIERHLRGSTGRGKSDTFYALVDTAARSGRAPRVHLDDLKEFADLRNAIEHILSILSIHPT